MLSRLCQSDSGAPAACSRASAATARSTSPICTAQLELQVVRHLVARLGERRGRSVLRPRAQLHQGRQERVGAGPGGAVARLGVPTLRLGGHAGPLRRLAPGGRDQHVEQGHLARRHHDLHPHHQLDRVAGGLRRGVERAVTPHRRDGGLQLLHRARQLGRPRVPAAPRCAARAASSSSRRRCIRSAVMPAAAPRVRSRRAPIMEADASSISAKA